MIKVRNEVTIYEKEGKDATGCPLPTIEVVSHWNRDSLVVLIIDGARVTVSARDLQAAIVNATNVGGR